MEIATRSVKVFDFSLTNSRNVRATIEHPDPQTTRETKVVYGHRSEVNERHLVFCQRSIGLGQRSVERAWPTRSDIKGGISIFGFHLPPVGHVLT